MQQRSKQEMATNEYDRREPRATHEYLTVTGSHVCHTQTYYNSVHVGTGNSSPIIGIFNAIAGCVCACVSGCQLNQYTGLTQALEIECVC